MILVMGLLVVGGLVIKESDLNLYPGTEVHEIAAAEEPPSISSPLPLEQISPPPAEYVVSPIPKPNGHEQTANQEITVNKPVKPDKVKPEASTKKNLISLTFDDGPDRKYTPQVLDILKKYGIKATFFLVGTQVEKYPEIAQRIVDEGHTIANHSWDHKNLTKLPPKALSVEIDKTQKAIYEATGITPTLLRAPTGAISKSVLDALHEREMLHVYWTVDTRDWAGTSVKDMYKNVMKNTHPGGIILLHSFGGRKNALDNTIDLLPKIIEDLTAKDYSFVTVEELITANQALPAIVK